MSGLRGQGNWSLDLGVWGGVRVRLHMFFFLFAVLTLFFAWRETPAAAVSGSMMNLSWMAVFSLVSLLIGVILHELGHYYVASQLGGGMKESVLTPLGGFTPVIEPADPLRAVAAHLAGPAANLVVCLLCLPGLMWGFSSASDMFTLLYPLAPMPTVTGSPWDAALKLFFWVNWLLVLVNLIPAYPFDGGRAARAGLSMLWQRGGRRTADALVTRVAQFSSIGLVLIAWLTRNVQSYGVAPPWFAMLLIAIFLLFSARQEPAAIVADEEEEPVARRRDGHVVAPWQYESPDDYTPPFPPAGYDDDFQSTGFQQEEETTGSPYGWLEQRREERRRHDLEAQAEEEQQVDEILARVHENGMSSLSPQDRELLDRVSRRYRQRPGNPS